jgi:dCMP deaminase
MIEFNNYRPPSWDELFMGNVYLIASKSKDKFTKIGSVLVRTNRIISEGYNGICMNVNDDVPMRHERPEKYFWYEHSERNCIFSAARFGISTLDSILYTNSIPCSDCTRAIIQSGIKEIVIHKQWMEYEEKFNRSKWNESCNRSEIMLKESNIPIRVFDKFLNVSAFLDGKCIRI